MREGGVEFGLEEGEEEVQEVDAEGVADWGSGSAGGGSLRMGWGGGFLCICKRVGEPGQPFMDGLGSILTNVPALGIEYAGEEEGEQDRGAYPAVCFVWGGFVQVGLV